MWRGLCGSRCEVAAMRRDRPLALGHDLLGSTHALNSALDEVVGRWLGRHVVGNHLTFSQLKLLKLVAWTDAHSLANLARFLGISRPAASKAVDRLVHRKLLRRTEQQADRRALKLSLTPRSKRLLAMHDEAWRRRFGRILAAFSSQELDQATDLLDRLSIGVLKNTGRLGSSCLRCGIYLREKCLLRDRAPQNCFLSQHQSRADAQPLDAGKNHNNNGAKRRPLRFRHSALDSAVPHALRVS